MSTIIESYPLSPMQQGMLFNTLYEPQSGIDIEQVVIDLPKELDPELLKKTLEKVIDRHQVLRTGFEWESLQEPVQFVLPRLTLPFYYLDWRNLSQVTQTETLESLLNEDRNQGYDLSKPPLLRFVLIQVGDQQFILIWSFHHILMDGRAIPYLLKEVSTIYRALYDGRDLELDPPSPYRSYIDWLQRQDDTGAEDFWREKLEGFKETTGVPGSHSYTKDNDSPRLPGKQTLWLKDTLTDSLKTFADEQQITLLTLLQAAWAVILSRYSGTDDVVFGIVKSNRNVSADGIDSKSLIGLLINTLPLRIKITSGTTLIEWLQEIRKEWVSLRTYELTPLAQIQSWSDISPGEGLFETIMGFERKTFNDRLQELGVGKGWKIIDLMEKTGFPLGFSGVMDQTLRLSISYDQSCYDSEFISRMLGHIQALLTGFIDQPNKKISELGILTEEEQKQIIIAWNQTKSVYPKEKCIHELFEIQVEKTPHSIAVEFEQFQLTYQELNSKANVIANYLINEGVAPEMKVGLSMHKSIEMLVGLLGIMKAGGVYIPLDPNLPQERISFMIEDSGISILLVQDELIEKYSSLNISQIPVASYLSNASQVNDSNPEINIEPENLVYIIYTSGSTGTPKGVAVRHLSLINNLIYANNHIYFEQDLLIPSLLNVSFDASVKQIFAPLLKGGKVWFLPEEVIADPHLLSEKLKDRQSFVINCMPSYWNAILNLIDQENIKINPDAIKKLIIGGEKFNRQLIDRTYSLFPDIEIWNMYGPTETTLNSTVSKVKSDSKISIGYPISNTVVYILDKQLRPVPIGIPGILYIGGVGLARGYYNNPSLTAQSFIPNPFSDEPGSRLYITGDYVKWRSDGSIEFIGRMDHQVKIRGFRIELGEIEAVLNQHSKIRSVVVIPDGDTYESKKLVAYIVLEDLPEPSSDELRSYCLKFLPEYMVPLMFIFLDSLPLTPTGKVDRHAIPEPKQDIKMSDSYTVAPSNPTEEILLGIWKDVLVIDGFGVTENFFRIGGNSISGTRVVSRVYSILGVEIPVRAIFERPTIVELAEYIKSLEPHM